MCQLFHKTLWAMSCVSAVSLQLILATNIPVLCENGQIVNIFRAAFRKLKAWMKYDFRATKNEEILLWMIFHWWKLFSESLFPRSLSVTRFLLLCQYTCNPLLNRTYCIVPIKVECFMIIFGCLLSQVSEVLMKDIWLIDQPLGIERILIVHAHGNLDKANGWVEQLELNTMSM